MRTVLLHPHPGMGGNQHNSVISALYAALEDPVRFDFVSSDADVAKGQVLEHLADGPAWLVGYSFGGGIASLVDDPRVLGWVLIAPALPMVHPVIGPDPRAKYVLSAAEDQFFAPETLHVATADWEAVTHNVLPGSDHFFRGYEQAVARDCVSWLSRAAA